MVLFFCLLSWNQAVSTTLFLEGCTTADMLLQSDLRVQPGCSTGVGQQHRPCNIGPLPLLCVSGGEGLITCKTGSPPMLSGVAWLWQQRECGSRHIRHRPVPGVFCSMMRGMCFVFDMCCGVDVPGTGLGRLLVTPSRCSEIHWCILCAPFYWCISCAPFI